MGISFFFLYFLPLHALKVLSFHILYYIRQNYGGILINIYIYINRKKSDFFLLKNIIALPFWASGWVQKVNFWFTFLILFLFVETFL